ncbi:hypothetical protein [Streptomyces sp. V4I2]|uniref:hypothetical protein n=1 Tax=Streptomyces sp. V4I2 TaxID=3042280 RepID=UPI00278471C4|nr:hypothetical protein [Streptomyces sp. V4I2]MDQ1041795.1 hypothetical protein [Streptomyces sp. V4I2]
MLPEVQKYVESVEAATTAQSAAVTAAGEKYPERHGYGEEGRRQDSAYSEEIGKAYTMSADAQKAAWEALKTSDDPLVKWIAENCGEYRTEAQYILAILPATADELDDLADTRDWCGVWGDFRQRAIDAGVMPGITPPSPARKAVFERIDREGLLSHGTGVQATHRPGPGHPDPGSPDR